MNHAFLNDPSFSGSMPKDVPGALFLVICLVAIVVVALSVRYYERRKGRCEKTEDAMRLLKAVASQCPKCDSRNTTTPDDEHPYTECRRCGARFGLCEVSIKVD